MLRNKTTILFVLLPFILSALFAPMTVYAAELTEETESAAVETIDGEIDAEPWESTDIPDTDESEDIPDTPEFDVGGMDDFMTMLELFSMFGMDEPEPGGPAAPQSPKPFTPDGQATVTDWATEYDGKEFYTFTTPAGSVFFLVIDHARASDNVYFLNAVTESDLISLAEKAGEPISESVLTPTADPPPEMSGNGPGASEPIGGDTEPTEEKNGGGNTGMVIFIVIAVLAIGGAGYYFKIVKPKKQSPDVADDDGEYDDEPEDDEDIPFADDTEESGSDSGDGDYTGDDYGDPDDEDMEESDGGKEDEDE